MAVFNVPNYLEKDGFGMSLNIRRGNPNPLDNSSVWASFDEAQEYARTSKIAYVGQILVVVEEIDEILTSTAYVIDNKNGDLKEIGASTETIIPVGDENTIEVAEDGTISLNGVKELPLTKEDGEGNQIVVTYQPRYKNGKLTWEELGSTTIEDVGVQLKGIEEDIKDLEESILTENDVKSLITDEAAKFNKAVFEKVEFLPDPLLAQPNVLYLLPIGDKFEIHAKIGDELVHIDDTDLSLEGYATKDDIKDFVKTETLNNYLLSSVLDTLVSKDGFEEVLNASATIETLIEAANKSHEHENRTILDSITQDLIDKWNLGEANVIGSVDSEEFTLQDKALAIKLISVEKVSGLTEKISTAIEEQLKDFNGTILDSISINNTALTIDDNKNIDLPIASNTALGLIYGIGSAKENKISIEEDGTLTVNSLNVNKLVQDEGSYFVLDGGSASQI